VRGLFLMWIFAKVVIEVCYNCDRYGERFAPI
jgi:hypothetical protein